MTSSERRSRWHRPGGARLFVDRLRNDPFFLQKRCGVGGTLRRSVSREWHTRLEFLPTEQKGPFRERGLRESNDYLHVRRSVPVASHGSRQHGQHGRRDGEGHRAQVQAHLPRRCSRRTAISASKGNLQIGQLLLYKTPNKWILNFPTKKHWRNPSRVEYIEAGLRKLRAHCSEMGFTSIAFPELGCGNGELDFETQVKPLMERYLGNLSVPTFVYLSGLKTDPPEHKDVRSIKRWLRSVPSALPFDEVWQDLVNILSEQRDFATLSKRSPYTAVATVNPPTITIASGNRTTRILADELLEFWQQLRDFGPDAREHCAGAPVRFLSATGLRRTALRRTRDGVDFIQRVAMEPWRRGLQVVPPPMPTEPVTGDLFARQDHAAQG